MYNAQRSGNIVPFLKQYITIMEHRMGPRCTDFSCQEEGFLLGGDDNPNSPIPNQEIRICNDRSQST